MKPTLVAGLRHTHRFAVTPAKTVPALYPESDLFLAMPEVFATGFMVGFLEWACIELLRGHLDEGEVTLGTQVDVSHAAATPPGMEVTAEVELLEVRGRKLVFAVRAHDGIDTIAEGRHERFLVDRAKFDARVAAKRERAAR